MYIYKITNKENGKVYIGQSIRPVEYRFKRHISDAINNIIDTHFSRAIRKYGESCFVCEVIDTAKTQQELNEKEQLWINFYNSVNDGYNETNAMYKCGGNTYMSKSQDEMKSITEKIRNSKLGDKNPQSKKIKIKNEETGEELFFNTVNECRLYFNENHHRFITTRINHITKSLYKGVWNISCADDEYQSMNNKVIQNRCNISVENLLTGEIKTFTSVRNMCESLCIPRSNIRIGKDIVVKNYKIFFK